MKRWMVVAVGSVALLEGLLYLSWSHIDGNDPFPSLEIQVAFVSGVGLFFMPHTLAAIARRGRPSLYPAAGTIGILLTLASALSPVLLIMTLPLVLIPSCVYLARTRFKPHATGILATPLLVLIAIASVWSLLFLSTNDGRCYYYVKFRNGTEIYRRFHGDSGEVGSMELPYRRRAVEEETSCSSDVTTAVESSLSLGLHGLMLVLGRAMTNPRSSSSDRLQPRQASSP
ncbi:MAG TPA: hypothetical protein VE174_06980 [Actinomycetota bacterium]|nr:hypothetical protein [Actinomycetota bacterium]